MKGKVNCTCGWSWNKSDSSKKDMYICHECGRDNSNNMKNGGWLKNYQNGGDTDNEDYNMKRALELGYTADESGHWPSVDYKTGEWLKSKKHHTRGMEMMAYELNPELRNKYNLIENEKGTLQYVDKKDFKNGGWLDSYADDIPQAQNGIEGTMGGLTDKGFNYNGAWGGQFQNGGNLDEEYRDAMRGMMKSKIGMGNAFNHPAIKRMSQAMPKTGMTPEGQGTHYMSSVDNYAVPLLQDLGEEELTLVDPDSRSREAIRFNSPEEAQYFAEYYKDVAPMSNTYKGLQEYAMGGSIPGSVGFTYARTKGIPSEGPYAKKTMASAQNGQEMKYYQEGLDWKPKTISREGSVIKDDRGQWEHPGQITEIGSNNITMQGVPYPVLGISDEGDTKLMKPGKNYKFKGKKVIEFPMAKNGINNLDAKPLQKLDNLLNFTNYNKPTGWLDKYK